MFIVVRAVCKLAVMRHAVAHRHTPSRLASLVVRLRASMRHGQLSLGASGSCASPVSVSSDL